VATKSAALCIPSAFVFGKKEKRGRAEMEDGPASACRGARANARLAGDLAPVAAEFVAFRGNVTLVYRTWVLQVVLYLVLSSTK
jgi:hypothetical protein